MTKKEFALLASALKTYYPKETLLPNEQALALWYGQLQDIPYNVAELAINKWVATNKWSPTIADIREQAAEISQGKIDDWGAAWEKVIKSISTYGIYRADEAMTMLDDITRRCVRRLGFNNLCLSENIAADRANFRIIYEQEVNRVKEEKQIPETMRLMIAQTINQLALEKGGD